jgi:hypothetical protein
VWADPESRSEAQHTDSVTKLKNLNLPDEYLWEQAGLSPQEVERVKAMRASSRLSRRQPIVVQPPSMDGAAAAGFRTGRVVPVARRDAGGTSPKEGAMPDDTKTTDASTDTSDQSNNGNDTGDGAKGQNGNDDQLGEGGKAALIAERVARQQAEREAKAVKRDLEALKAQSMSDAEKAVAAAKAEGRTEALDGREPAGRESRDSGCCGGPDRPGSRREAARPRRVQGRRRRRR